MPLFRKVVIAALVISLNAGCYLAKVSSWGTPEYEDKDTGFSLLWG